jgi:hypothetical protein
MNEEDKKELNYWLNDCISRNGKNLEKSSVFTAIFTESYLKSPECALQVGLAMMMDKPIILIADKNTRIPSNLIKVAKLIEKVDMSSQDELKRASESIQKFVDSL